MGHVLVMVFALFAFGCAGQGGESIENRCVRMRDHLIELRLADVPASRPGAPPNHKPDATERPTATSPPSVSLRAQHRATLRAALGDDFAERCARTMTVAQVDCVIGARDRDTADTCIGKH